MDNQRLERLFLVATVSKKFFVASKSIQEVQIIILYGLMAKDEKKSEMTSAHSFSQSKNLILGESISKESIFAEYDDAQPTFFLQSYFFSAKMSQIGVFSFDFSIMQMKLALYDRLLFSLMQFPF